MPSIFEKISALNSAYIRCIDHDQLEQWPNFFTEDCLYKVTTAENVKNNLPAGMIYATSKNMLTDRISALREANIYEKHMYRHIIGLPFILSEIDGIIKSETPYLVLRIMHDGKTEIFSSGIYADIFTSNNNQLLLQERIVICDSDQIDTLLAIPL